MILFITTIQLINMKRLFINTSMDEVTILDDRKQPYHIPPNTKLALKSCSFKLHYPSEENAILTTTEEFKIHFRKYKSESKTFAETINFPVGNYSIKTLVKHVGDNSLKLELTMQDNGNIKLSIENGYQILVTNDDFWKVIGIGVAPKVWYGPGNFFGRPAIDDPLRLNLIWNELDDDKHNFLDGQPSKMMHSFPLFDRPKFINNYYENPVFLPIASSTDQLHFRFESKPEVRVSDIILELLLK